MLTLHIDSDSSRHVLLHCLIGLLSYNKYYAIMSTDFAGTIVGFCLGFCLFLKKPYYLAKVGPTLMVYLPPLPSTRNYWYVQRHPVHLHGLALANELLILCLSFSFSGWTFLWMVPSAPRKSGHGPISATNGTVAEQCVACRLKHTDEEDNMNISSFNISLTMTYRTDDSSCHFYTCFLLFKGRAKNYRKLILISVFCNIEILIFTRIPLVWYAMSHSVFCSLLLIYLNLIKLQFYLY